MAVAKARTDVELCKGCMLCVDVCPRKAIVPSNRVNKKGYQIVVVDKELCVGCGMCYKVCPDYVYTIG